MIDIEALRAIIYSFPVLQIAESRTWLIVFKNDFDTSGQIIKKVCLSINLQENLNILNVKNQLCWRKRQYLCCNSEFPFCQRFLLFFYQVSGIKAFLYYAPRIFALAGLSKSSSFLSSIGFGIVNLILTLSHTTPVTKISLNFWEIIATKTVITPSKY
ncbi:MAG: MFS transporter [Melioribacteraceae bacterium]|nr:MFS transporter [Melioribacteraceae bacterium]MCF8413498.1 MFS transporter [Melioribacteraceae bacterium]